MNIRGSLMAEHSKQQALRIAAYACSSTKRFKELMHCFLADDVQLAQRAAWSVRWSLAKNLSMIKPYIGDLVAILERTDVHDAVIRNALKILNESEVPGEYHGSVMTACFRIAETPSSPIAWKSYALSILQKLAVLYPEIAPELKLLIEENWDTSTAAFRSRGKKVLASLSRLKKKPSI